MKRWMNVCSNACPFCLQNQIQEKLILMCGRRRLADISCRSWSIWMKDGMVEEKQELYGNGGVAYGRWGSIGIDEEWRCGGLKSNKPLNVFPWKTVIDYDERLMGV
ncbi:uncharacterized protein LOC120119638 [Hibiscus syriacus]|uniref:uncharacterized protein LOC120119638 n=1 Tax=Hibiscus syriacus TaxID=106335 RepID=UPI001920936B|nr:uncharacterized protein LOC120119638 [Hibiscus syriacus]